MSELLQVSGDCGNFAALGEPQRQAMLVKTMGSSTLIDEGCLAPLTRETLGLFRMLRQAVERFGPDCLGGHVISMIRMWLIVIWSK